MIVYAKIRRMYFREKLSISETGWPRAISRKTSLSRNTVKKWLREPEEEKTRNGILCTLSLKNDVSEPFRIGKSPAGRPYRL